MTGNSMWLLGGPCNGKVAPQWALGSRGQQKSGCSRPAFQQLSWQRRTHRQATATLEPAVAQREPIAAQDQWIQKLLNLIPHDAIDRSDDALRQASIETLKTQRMPTIRNEQYRYTDVSMLLKTQPQIGRGQVDPAQIAQLSLGKDDNAVRLVLVDGRFSTELSSIGQLPDGIFIGSLENAPYKAAQCLGQQAKSRGGPFAILNGALAEDIMCISLQEATEFDRPIHIIYHNTGQAESDAISVCSPRMLVHLEERSSCQIIEEFVGSDSSTQSFSNSVTEISLATLSQLNHKYVGLEGSEAWHMKASLVTQAEGSKYQITEAQLGGRLTRHDLSIQQTGPDTETIMKAFLLCGPSQLHDLHSKLQLEHPRAVANQLHKCIVSASSGKGVFDGNVKVERLAQQTDAAQLSRNILLSPKATVNVKPNLQIIADDVKCSHGCAVSDLEEEQLFYFRTRGIDYATARQVLVYSFGAEVTNDFKFEHLNTRIQHHINSTLAKAPLS